MRSLRSCGFLIPAKTIFVPFIFFLALLYEYPSALPDVFPMNPYRLGPCLCAPPASTVWHCEHFVLKTLAPFFSFPPPFPPPFFLAMIALVEVAWRRGRVRGLRAAACGLTDW